VRAWEPRQPLAEWQAVLWGCFLHQKLPTAGRRLSPSSRNKHILTLKHCAMEITDNGFTNFIRLFILKPFLDPDNSPSDLNSSLLDIRISLLHFKAPNYLLGCMSHWWASQDPLCCPVLPALYFLSFHVLQKNTSVCQPIKGVCPMKRIAPDIDHRNERQDQPNDSWIIYFEDLCLSHDLLRTVRLKAYSSYLQDTSSNSFKKLRFDSEKRQWCFLLVWAVFCDSWQLVIDRRSFTPSGCICIDAD
jgi:hypothetical protein